jgi:hypothetical protein
MKIRVPRHLTSFLTEGQTRQINAADESNSSKIKWVEVDRKKNLVTATSLHCCGLSLLCATHSVPGVPNLADICRELSPPR